MHKMPRDTTDKRHTRDTSPFTSDGTDRLAVKPECLRLSGWMPTCDAFETREWRLTDVSGNHTPFEAATFSGILRIIRALNVPSDATPFKPRTVTKDAWVPP